MARIYDKSDVSARAMKQEMELFEKEIGTDFGLVNLDRLDQKMMTKIKEDNPKYILGYGFLSRGQWIGDGKINEFLKWVIEGKALFFRHPVVIGDIILKCVDLVNGKLDSSEMIGQIYLKKNKTLVGTLLHDLYPYKSRETKDRALVRAEAELGVTGSEEEVVEKLKQIAQKLNAGTVSSEVTDGVFCDVEGTLWQDEQLNQEVVQVLRKYEQDGKTITIWTGGDVEKYQQLLLEAGLDWKIVSKYDFSGKRTELVIDDLDKAGFMRLYGIVPEKFIKIERS